jgi:hypothetical protein
MAIVASDAGAFDVALSQRASLQRALFHTRSHHPPYVRPVRAPPSRARPFGFPARSARRALRAVPFEIDCSVRWRRHIDVNVVPVIRSTSPIAWPSATWLGMATTATPVHSTAPSTLPYPSALCFTHCSHHPPTCLRTTGAGATLPGEAPVFPSRSARRSRTACSEVARRALFRLFGWLSTTRRLECRIIRSIRRFAWPSATWLGMATTRDAGAFGRTVDAAISQRALLHALLAPPTNLLTYDRCCRHPPG